MLKTCLILYVKKDREKVFLLVPFLILKVVCDHFYEQIHFEKCQMLVSPLSEKSSYRIT